MGKPLFIVTTNYDRLIELAFDQAGSPYDLVIHTTDPGLGDQIFWRAFASSELLLVNPNELDIDLKKTSVIYKMHGHVEKDDPQRDQFVITEDDYFDFLARMVHQNAIPAIFAESFQRVIYSRALLSESTPSASTDPVTGALLDKGDPNLGVELDTTLTYTSGDGIKAFAEWGVLQPLDGLSYEGAKLSRAHFLALGLAARF